MPPHRPAAEPAHSAPLGVACLLQTEPVGPAGPPTRRRLWATKGACPPPQKPSTNQGLPLGQSSAWPSSTAGRALALTRLGRHRDPDPRGPGTPSAPGIHRPAEPRQSLTRSPGVVGGARCTDAGGGDTDLGVGSGCGSFLETEATRLSGSTPPGAPPATAQSGGLRSVPSPRPHPQRGAPGLPGGGGSRRKEGLRPPQLLSRSPSAPRLGPRAGGPPGRECLPRTPSRPAPGPAPTAPFPRVGEPGRCPPQSRLVSLPAPAPLVRTRPPLPPSRLSLGGRRNQAPPPTPSWGPGWTPSASSPAPHPPASPAQPRRPGHVARCFPASSPSAAPALAGGSAWPVPRTARPLHWSSPQLPPNCPPPVTRSPGHSCTARPRPRSAPLPTRGTQGALPSLPPSKAAGRGLKPRNGPSPVPEPRGPRSGAGGDSPSAPGGPRRPWAGGHLNPPPLSRVRMPVIGFRDTSRPFTPSHPQRLFQNKVAVTGPRAWTRLWRGGQHCPAPPSAAQPGSGLLTGAALLPTPAHLRAQHSGTARSPGRPCGVPVGSRPPRGWTSPPPTPPAPLLT